MTGNSVHHQDAMVIFLSTLLSSSLLAIPLPLGENQNQPQHQCAEPIHPFGVRTLALGTFDDAHRDLRRRVEDLLLTVQQGQVSVNLRDQVRRDLERLRFFPDRVAADPGVDALITRAMLVVAAAVQTCDPVYADAWVDRALGRHGVAGIADPSILAGLPIELLTLVQARNAQRKLDPPAAIRIDCEIACAAFVDGHNVPVTVGEVKTYSVTPGKHDVWIFNVSDGATVDGGSARASFAEVELFSGMQDCVSFPDPRELGLLPTRVEWWSAWSFAQRFDWAMESKKLVTRFPVRTFEDLLDESPQHTLVLARDSGVRELRFRLALNLADLYQRAGETEKAKAVLERALLWAELLDSHDVLAAMVGKFMFLGTPFVASSAVTAGAPRGTIEIECRRCVASVDGVVVDFDSFDLPVSASAYEITIYPSSAKGEVEHHDTIVVADKPSLITYGPPRKQIPLPEPIDLVEGVRQSPQLQRWVWGAAGGAALTGGVAWSFGLAAGSLRGIKGIVPESAVSFSELRAQKVVVLGLAVTGAFVLHAEIAAYMFSRMPPSRRPGRAMVVTGSGLLVSSGLLAGLGIVGAVSYQNATKDRKSAIDARNTADAAGEDTSDYIAQVKKSEKQQSTSKAVSIVGAVISGALLISGTTLAVVGTQRSKKAKRDGIVLPARVPPYQRPGAVPIILGSGLLMAAPAFIGFGTAAILIKKNQGEKKVATESAIGGFIAAGVLGVSGAILVAVGATRKYKSKSRTVIVPSFGRNSIGFAVAGKF